MPTKIPLITTADQLLAASDELGPCELARGELIMMTPAGDEHSRIEATVFGWAFRSSGMSTPKNEPWSFTNPSPSLGLTAKMTRSLSPSSCLDSRCP
jgi:hypothetical protein